MNRETAGQAEKSGHGAATRRGSEEPAKDESVKEKWDASWERLALGVGAAAGGGLLAAMWIGVGPVALAGAAGYLAYRELNEKRRPAEGGVKP
jgi:hypothetical protein